MINKVNPKNPPGNPNIRNIGFGSRPKEVDDEYRSRIKGVPRKRVWTKEKCVEELEDILSILKKVLKEDNKLEISNPKKLKNETVRDCITLMNKILDYMKYLYPPMQENLNVNVDIQLEDIIKKWRKKKGIMVVEDA